MTTKKPATALPFKCVTCTTYARLVQTARALVSANVRYQSAEIARRHKATNSTIAEEAVAYDARQAAINGIEVLLRELGEEA